MIIKLNQSTSDGIKSSYEINSIHACLVELVLNSVDANSTIIVINLNKFNIQINDNGDGITRDDLELIGQK